MLESIQNIRELKARCDKNKALELQDRLMSGASDRIAEINRFGVSVDFTGVLYNLERSDVSKKDDTSLECKKNICQQLDQILSVLSKMNQDELNLIRGAVFSWDDHLLGIDDHSFKSGSGGILGPDMGHYESDENSVKTAIEAYVDYMHLVRQINGLLFDVGNYNIRLSYCMEHQETMGSLGLMVDVLKDIRCQIGDAFYLSENLAIRIHYPLVITRCGEGCDETRSPAVFLKSKWFDYKNPDNPDEGFIGKAIIELSLGATRKELMDGLRGLLTSTMSEVLGEPEHQFI